MLEIIKDMIECIIVFIIVPLSILFFPLINNLIIIPLTKGKNSTDRIISEIVFKISSKVLRMWLGGIAFLMRVFSILVFLYFGFQIFLWIPKTSHSLFNFEKQLALTLCACFQEAWTNLFK